jgi:hypothetical protein
MYERRLSSANRLARGGDAIPLGWWRGAAEYRFRGNIQDDYREAASVVGRSPRAAAALLRLCVQKLCKQLGLPGKKIDDDIAELVRRGLDPEIQRALDTLRVTGNAAVHPLQMDITDDRSTALALFSLVNYIADRMITHPIKLNKLYEALPAGARDAIKRRDGDA